MIRIVSNFSKMKTQDFISFCRGLHTSLLNNVYFPNVSPSLADFLAAIVLLEQLSARALSRDRNSILERNSQYATVLEFVYQISGFVLYTAQNTSGSEEDAKTKILTTGFKLVAEPGSQVVTTPENVRAAATGSGSCIVRWDKTTGTYSYIVQRCTSVNPADPFSTWVDCGVTTRTSIQISDLQPLTVAAFRIISVGGHEVLSEASDIATCVIG